MAIQKKHYDIEKQGQCDFFDNYQIDYQGDNSILVDNTDGVYCGNIMEFKLNINNTGKVLFQAIKYLSRMRIKGESVPARILLVDLNATKIYVYNSADYIDDIQKVYVGAASKNNDAFSKDITPVAEYDYMDMVDSAEIKKLLINEDANWYIPIDLDENCIVGWAERYYRENPKATKGDFLGDGTGKINLKGEIRNPIHFEGLINPYTEATNEKFKYLMDCLNDRLNKKDLGAFYTPIPYCQKAAELVEKAVARVPDGNDYIILDRCAGTGNLESALYGRYDKNGDELISHCVVSTYEYYEYKVLLERIGQDVRNIIPPTEAQIEFANGMVSNADAMSKDYIDNPLIKPYVNEKWTDRNGVIHNDLIGMPDYKGTNGHCTIILFENPPYADSSASDNAVDGDKTKKAKTNRKNTYIAEQYKKSASGYVREMRGSSRDLSNLFIWSGFHYYLRQPTDSYIVFSPVKYFKSVGLVDNEMLEGYVFNRDHFHATASAISCILWSNVAHHSDSHTLSIFDIDKNDALIALGTIDVHNVYTQITELIDKRMPVNYSEDGVYCGSDGIPLNISYKKGRKPIYSDEIIAYLSVQGYQPKSVNVYLVRANFKTGMEQSFGFHLHKDNYLQKIVLFVSKLFYQDNWYEQEIYFNSADGGDAYIKDKAFLKSCLIYTCLSNQNKCLSFTGSDGRYYRNELCFDTTNGDTVASADLAKMTLDAESQKLMSLWGKVLEEAKKTVNYNSKLTYGVYQITKELNTSHEEGTGTFKKTVYDYPKLNGYLTALRDALKAYYKSHITDKMFKYELLK